MYESEMVNHEIGYFQESRKATASDYAWEVVAAVLIFAFAFLVLKFAL